MRTSWERHPGEDIMEWNRRCVEAEHSLPWWLYRQLDADGVLLYVGTTEAPAPRTRLHRSASPWFGLVARIRWELHPNYWVASDLEKQAIQTEGPLYNIVHSTDRAAAKARRDAPKGLAA